MTETNNNMNNAASAFADPAERAEYEEEFSAAVDAAAAGSSSVAAPAPFLNALPPAKVMPDPAAPTAAHKTRSMSGITVSNFSEYMANGFDADQQEFERSARQFTGFSNIDKDVQLAPGLYVIGAVSSLGKTTFMTQMASQIAEGGTAVIPLSDGTGDRHVSYAPRDVLYFTLEQDSMDISSKILARKNFELSMRAFSGKVWNMKDQSGLTREFQANDISLSSTDICIGMGKNDPNGILAAARQETMQKIGDRMHICNASFRTTVEDITAVVEDFIAETGTAPVVIIDYLQVIAPTPDSRGRIPDQRGQVEHAVDALKNLQERHKLVLFVISALSRKSYWSPVTMDSFKESGRIEYSADALWGLDYAVMHASFYQNKANTDDDRKAIIDDYRHSRYRDIQLTCMKTRKFGMFMPKYFIYYPACDTFHPVEGEDMDHRMSAMAARFYEAQDARKKENEKQEKAAKEAAQEAADGTSWQKNPPLDAETASKQFSAVLEASSQYGASVKAQENTAEALPEQKSASPAENQSDTPVKPVSANPQQNN